MLLAVSSSALALDRSTTLIIQNMSNTEIAVTEAMATSGKFADTVPKLIGSMGQITVKSVNDQVLTGCSGTLVLEPNHAGGFIVIQWDNPYIGSNSYKYSEPPGWDVFGIKGANVDDGSGNDATLTIRIEGKVAVGQRGPTVPLPTSGAGVVQGRVLWPTNFGSPSMNVALRSAYVLQPGAGPERFFKFTVTQPSQFQEYALNGSLTAVYRDGTRGEYIAPQNTGKLTFLRLPSPVPGYDGFAFSISNLPIGVPVSISVGPLPGVTWQPPKPIRVEPVAGASLQASFYCIATDLEADLTPKMQQVAGFDFTVAAEWVASGSPVHALVRATAGSQKSTVQFGTLDPETVAAVTAMQSTTRTLPAVRR
jgi:hypothetical protein